MLPSHGIQGAIGPYEEQRRVGSIDAIQLPEIQSNKHANQGLPYDNNMSNGRGVYNYKSTIDQQNSAMISKLMSRKKSYERMMVGNDGQSGSRLQNVAMHPELSQKKSQEVLMTQNRANQLSRANREQNPVKKQLQYYESTPQNPGSRKHTSSMRGKNGGSTSTPTILDVTGKNV